VTGLAIEVRFLTGRFVATAHNDRDRTEWPPHPARLFSAMVATWADSDEPDPDERAALEWLEAQGPPDIAASAATPRTVVTHFVPVNDTAVVGTSFYNRRSQRLDALAESLDAALASSAGATDKEVVRLQTKRLRERDVSVAVSNAGNTPESAAVELLPAGRGKQPRTFPSATPDSPFVTFAWPTEPEHAVRVNLDRLLARVTRIGHSSSLVSCRLVADPPPANWTAGPGQMTIRSIRPGQLAALEKEHQKHRASRPRSLPFTAVTYRAVRPSAVDSAVQVPDTAGEWVVFEFAPRSRQLPATNAVAVARALRATVFRHAADPLPEGLTGHRDDGSPLDRPHVGFLPLPFVGVEHADGRLMGVSIALPDALDSESRSTVLRAIGEWEQNEPSLQLTLGPAGVLELTRVTGLFDLMTLDPAVWRQRSNSWVSATPIALPSHPGDLRARNSSARTKAWARAEEAVVASCRHVGLSDPTEVTVSLQPLTRGSRPAPRYPAFRQAGRAGVPVARRLVHAAVTFEQPVDGPLVLGAGRYLGLGLMRPAPNRGTEQ